MTRAITPQEIIDDLRRRLDDLEGVVTGRHGEVPHVSSDPATLRDGMVWVRSDLGQLCFRADGVTIRVP